MPQLQQSFSVPVNQRAAWAFFSDLERTFRCLPGCERVAARPDGSYDLEVSVRVGIFGGRFQVNMKIVEADPPHRLVSRAGGKDSRTASSVHMTTTLELAPAGDGEATEVRFRADVKLFGALGNFGWGIVEKKARELGAQFAEQVRAEVAKG